MPRPVIHNRRPGANASANAGATARRRSGVTASLLAIGALVAAGLGATALLDARLSPAAAQSSCEIDFGIMQTKRNEHIEALNVQAKKNKGQLDPRSACPRLRNLAAVEKEMHEYMTKNQRWCNIPAEPITQMEETQKRTAELATQACRAAAQIRRQEEAAKRGQAGGMPQRPKLPAGPL